jgi:hypothetical protein
MWLDFMPKATVHSSRQLAGWVESEMLSRSAWSTRAWPRKLYLASEPLRRALQLAGHFAQCAPARGG